MVLIISPFIIFLNMRQFYGVFCLLIFDFSLCVGSPLEPGPTTTLLDRKLKDTHAVLSEPVNLTELLVMLEDHYKSAYNISCVGARDGHKTGLRLLKSPETGVVLISQISSSNSSFKDLQPHQGPRRYHQQLKDNCLNFLIIVSVCATGKWHQMEKML
ncbi:uncharacterized protein LOC110865108 isoform X2 [Helianthus annuus]|uniref:uncharacterized protein LOC110865108 isoform X2 n=1 Tax=Helianthus annuus TaxID=4232 RepID=UPI000B8FCC6F|nr:uncharacterized protein LOC110865108 isoform X2 [Helianthus annuus]